MTFKPLATKASRGALQGPLKGGGSIPHCKDTHQPTEVTCLTPAWPVTEGDQGWTEETPCGQVL